MLGENLKRVFGRRRNSQQRSTAEHDVSNEELQLAATGSGSIVKIYAGNADQAESSSLLGRADPAPSTSRAGNRRSPSPVRTAEAGISPSRRAVSRTSSGISHHNMQLPTIDEKASSSITLNSSKNSHSSQQTLDAAEYDHYAEHQRHRSKSPKTPKFPHIPPVILVTQPSADTTEQQQQTDSAATLMPSITMSSTDQLPFNESDQQNRKQQRFGSKQQHAMFSTSQQQQQQPQAEPPAANSTGGGISRQQSVPLSSRFSRFTRALSKRSKNLSGGPGTVNGGGGGGGGRSASGRRRRTTNIRSAALDEQDENEYVAEGDDGFQHVDDIMRDQIAGMMRSTARQTFREQILERNPNFDQVNPNLYNRGRMLAHAGSSGGRDDDAVLQQLSHDRESMLHFHQPMRFDEEISELSQHHRHRQGVADTGLSRRTNRSQKRRPSGRRKPAGSTENQENVPPSIHLHVHNEHAHTVPLRGADTATLLGGQNDTEKPILDAALAANTRKLSDSSDRRVIFSTESPEPPSLMTPEKTVTNVSLEELTKKQPVVRDPSFSSTSAAMLQLLMPQPTTTTAAAVVDPHSPESFAATTTASDLAVVTSPVFISPSRRVNYEHAPKSTPVPHSTPTKAHSRKNLSPSAITALDSQRKGGDVKFFFSDTELQSLGEDETDDDEPDKQQVEADHMRHRAYTQAETDMMLSSSSSAAAAAAAARSRRLFTQRSSRTDQNGADDKLEAHLAKVEEQFRQSLAANQRRRVSLQTPNFYAVAGNEAAQRREARLQHHSPLHRALAIDLVDFDDLKLARASNKSPSSMIKELHVPFQPRSSTKRTKHHHHHVPAIAHEPKQQQKRKKPIDKLQQQPSVPQDADLTALNTYNFAPQISTEPPSIAFDEDDEDELQNSSAATAASAPLSAPVVLPSVDGRTLIVSGTKITHAIAEQPPWRGKVQFTLGSVASGLNETSSATSLLNPASLSLASLTNNSVAASPLVLSVAAPPPLVMSSISAPNAIATEQQHAQPPSPRTTSVEAVDQAAVSLDVPSAAAAAASKKHQSPRKARRSATRRTTTHDLRMASYAQQDDRVAEDAEPSSAALPLGHYNRPSAISRQRSGADVRPSIPKRIFPLPSDGDSGERSRSPRGSASVGAVVGAAARLTNEVELEHEIARERMAAVAENSEADLDFIWDHRQSDFRAMQHRAAKLKSLRANSSAVANSNNSVAAGKRNSSRNRSVRSIIHPSVNASASAIGTSQQHDLLSNAGSHLLLPGATSTHTMIPEAEEDAALLLETTMNNTTGSSSILKHATSAGVRDAAAGPLPSVSFSSGTQAGARPRARSPTAVRKPYHEVDHTPHEVFVELEELRGAAGWHETARWVKYEEDVEEKAGRWGKPHVASLSFHSLTNLRRCLEKGVVLLDIDEVPSYGDLAYKIVREFNNQEGIELETEWLVLRALLAHHQHFYDTHYVDVSQMRRIQSRSDLHRMLDAFRRAEQTTTVPPQQQQYRDMTAGSTAGLQRHNTTQPLQSRSQQWKQQQQPAAQQQPPAVTATLSADGGEAAFMNGNLSHWYESSAQLEPVHALPSPSPLVSQQQTPENGFDKKFQRQLQIANGRTLNAMGLSADNVPRQVSFADTRTSMLSPTNPLQSPSSGAKFNGRAHLNSESHVHSPSFLQPHPHLIHQSPHHHPAAVGQHSSSFAATAKSRLKKVFSQADTGNLAVPKNLLTQLSSSSLSKTSPERPTNHAFTPVKSADNMLTTPDILLAPMTAPINVAEIEKTNNRGMNTSQQSWGRWFFRNRRGQSYYPSSTAGGSVDYTNMGSLERKKRIQSSGRLMGGSIAAGEETNPLLRTLHRVQSNLEDEITRLKKIARETPVFDPTQRFLEKHSILSKVPPNAEATAVLVGPVPGLDQTLAAFVRLARAQHLDGLMEAPIPVRFLFVLLGPERSQFNYHQIGRSLSTLMSNKQFHTIAYRADDKSELIDAMNEFLDYSVVLPPGHVDSHGLIRLDDALRLQQMRLRKHTQQRQKAEKMRRRREAAAAAAAVAAANGDSDRVKLLNSRSSDNSKSSSSSPDGVGADKSRDAEMQRKVAKPLKWTIPPDNLTRRGRPFAGLFNDIRRRFPHYKSDFTDALDFQCLASIIFIFFATIAPAITFGGLLNEKTDSLMGVTELLFSTSLTGVIFALFSAQPLMVIGATGPFLVYEESLYKFCASNSIDFLTFRVWIGLWVLVIAVVVVAFEGSVLVHYFTRFSEEIFAVLIAFIFLFESLEEVLHTFHAQPLITLDTYRTTNFSTSHHEALHQQHDDSVVTPSPQETEHAMHNFEQKQEWLDKFHERLTNNAMPRNLSYGGAAVSAVPMLPSEYLEPMNQPNTALFSLMLMLGTFILAFKLKSVRNSRYFSRPARRALGDYGVPIALIIMSSLDYLVTPFVYTRKIRMPEGILVPTSSHLRGWFINPFVSLDGARATPVWVCFAAVLPAFLVFILLFVEVEITELIINKKERKLKKGTGYHLDLLLICAMVPLSSFLGMPWMCAATVRSVAHVQSLTVWSTRHAPGERPFILRVIDQRVTCLVMSILIGLFCLFGHPVLKIVPIAALFGIFLYLGVNSSAGVQFIKRLTLLLKPRKHHPEVGYVKRVKAWKMNVFTLIQLACLIVLVVVKSSPLALAFPFFVLLLVPVRMSLGWLYSAEELHELDKEDADLLQGGLLADNDKRGSSDLLVARGAGGNGGTASNDDDDDDDDDDGGGGGSDTEQLESDDQLVVHTGKPNRLQQYSSNNSSTVGGLRQRNSTSNSRALAGDHDDDVNSDETDDEDGGGGGGGHHHHHHGRKSDEDFYEEARLPS